MKREEVLAEARRVLTIEGEAVLALRERLGMPFYALVEKILDSKGRVVVSGIGKSGLIGRKISATLSSTGTPSFFLHPTEALHGEVGVLTREDILLALSHGGETEEVLNLLPVCRRLGVAVAVMTGHGRSRLAREGDLVLEVLVEEEACPLGLAPTASSTATLALGDALAMALLSARGFAPQDFARFHPAGRLGRQLLLRVSDVLALRGQNPVIQRETTVEQALLAMTSSRMGAVSVVDGEGKLIGIITDGDIRRGLARERDQLLKQRACDIMTRSPMSIGGEQLAAEALHRMEEGEVGHLPVLDAEGRPLGLVNYQDLFQAGIV